MVLECDFIPLLSILNSRLTRLSNSYWFLKLLKNKLITRCIASLANSKVWKNSNCPREIVAGTSDRQLKNMKIFIWIFCSINYFSIKFRSIKSNCRIFSGGVFPLKLNSPPSELSRNQRIITVIRQRGTVASLEEFSRLEPSPFRVLSTALWN